MELFTGDIKTDLKFEDLGTIHSKKAGEVLSHNMDNEHLGILLEGYAKLAIYNENGKESVFVFLKPVSSFGDIRVLSGKVIPYHLMCVAITPVKYVMVTIDDLFAYIAKKPELAYFLLQTAAEKIASLVARLHDESFRNSLTIIAEFLLAYASINREIHLTHHELSESIGKNRVTVSRALLKLQKAGIIKQGKKRIVVTDIDKLQQVANGVLDLSALK